LMKLFLKALPAACIVAYLWGCVLPDPAGNLPEEGGCRIVQGDTGPDRAHYAAFVTTTDYSLTGGFGVIDTERLCTWSPDPGLGAGVSSPDPVARAFGDYVLVINRYTYDSVSVLDKNWSLVNQYSVAGRDCDPANPHDMEFANEYKAYVTRYECRDLWIINPVTGEFLDSIDLSAEGYGGSDGIPEMSGMLLLGNTLMVAVQMMDRSDWSPEGPGRLVMIDTLTDTVAGEITLRFPNPVTDIAYSPSLDAAVVGTLGDHNFIGDGGIEAADPYSGKWLGVLIGETTLGGNIGDFEIAGPTKGYATISDRNFRSSLVRFDPSAGTRSPGAIYTADSGFTLWDVALSDGGKLYVCDRTATRPGVAVVDTLTDTLATAGPIDLGLPPFSIVFLK